MNTNHIEQLRALVSWVRRTTGKSANLEVNFWHHGHSDEPTTEYKLWIQDEFCQSSKDSGMLIALIPYIRSLCASNTLQEVAA